MPRKTKRAKRAKRTNWKARAELAERNNAVLEETAHDLNRWREAVRQLADALFLPMKGDIGQLIEERISDIEVSLRP